MLRLAPLLPPGELTARDSYVPPPQGGGTSLQTDPPEEKIVLEISSSASPKWFLIMSNIVASVPKMFFMIKNHLGLVADDFGKIFPAGFEKSLHGLYMIVPPLKGEGGTIM